MTVYFCNQEPIDLNTISLMGVSVKKSENPIGYFGTGLKFALATLLRTGHTITLIRDGERIDFTSREEEIRGEQFDRVMMGDEPLGFTTRLGRNWEPWQAYRELHCNCTDEGGIIETELLDGEWGTIFEVSGDAIENCHLNRHDIFLSTTRLDGDASCEIHPGSSQYAFYRGVRAHKHDAFALYTYNIKSQLDLTEDRTVKETFWMKLHIAHMIPKMRDENVIADVLLADRGTFEASLSIDSSGRPSDEFMAVVNRLRSNRQLNLSALKLWQKYAGHREVYDPVALDAFDLEVLDKALALLKRLQCEMSVDDFIVVESLGDGCYGLVRQGQIVISKATFDMGHRFLASTLYEEWLHLNHQFEDESRPLQNLLFERLFSMVERVCAIEATDRAA